MSAPKGNKNAEKWSIKEARDFLDKALELSKNTDYDFLGEVARDLDSYRDVFDYLIKTYPDLTGKLRQVKGNLEANCFANGKKGKIKDSLAIMNLKSNYRWTDRQEIDHTTGGEKINLNVIVDENATADMLKQLRNGTAGSKAD
jgi:hypothetical protein